MDNRHIPVKNKLGEGNLFKISRFKERIKKTKPHKHEGYYEIIYLSQGEGFHWMDTKHYKVRPPEIYFLKPGSLHCWQFTSIPKGFVILFKEDYFDAVKEANITELLQHMEEQMRVALPDDYPSLSIFEEILNENSLDSPYADRIIHGYMQALLSKIVQLSQISQSTSSPATGLHERFSKLLSEKCPELHQVNQYAQLLHTSPQNLNAACRRYTDKSAAEHIAAQLLLEAKRYILHTEKQINEIAYALHFNDPSYFIKFFKKHTGLTPGQFRQQHFQ